MHPPSQSDSHPNDNPRQFVFPLSFILLARSPPPGFSSAISPCFFLFRLLSARLLRARTPIGGDMGKSARSLARALLLSKEEFLLPLPPSILRPFLGIQFAAQQHLAAHGRRRKKRENNKKEKCEKNEISYLAAAAGAKRNLAR
jgi:hypothetical protein